MKKTSFTYFNRELSWIEFNARVLSEALSSDVPLLERLRFLTIVTSNYDEFFMVRVAGLKRQAKLHPDWRDMSGMTAKEQLTAISARTHQIVKKQYECLNKDILPLLKKENIIYTAPSSYSPDQHSFVERLFRNEIFPLLTPLRTDTEIGFPHITNLKLHAAFLLEPLFHVPSLPGPFMYTPDTQPLAVVQIPTSIRRIVWLPSEPGTTSFTVLDDVIQLFGTQLFPGFSVKETLLFKVARDADFAVDEDRSTDFIQAMEEVLVERQSSRPVRIICNGSSKAIRDILTEKLELDEQDVYEVQSLIDLTTLSDLINIEEAHHLRNPQWKHFYPVELSVQKPMWDILKERDITVHLPYQSYDPVISFISDASEDPHVLAIKMTLYRTSGDSPIVHALERAARNGKQVTVFVELKARFDEQRNISWASEMERAGVIVVYGIANMKVHAKLLLVVRREQTGVFRYVHLSTGNYNDKTARLYSDISLFTSNDDIANDATLFFNMISGYSSIQTMKRLIMAPINLKDQLLTLIEREIHHSETESPGLIIAKMNSLGDQDIIDALYRASNANVQIILNIRGVCMLAPGVKGQSENITVFSIIDRYLEHSRIFYFQNGGDEEMYLSSADWMPRNLERRVELMFPVLHDEVFKDIKNILVGYCSDNVKSHTLRSDGSWTKLGRTDTDGRIRAQEMLFTRYKKESEKQDNEVPREFLVRRTEPSL